MLEAPIYFFTKKESNKKGIYFKKHAKKVLYN